MESGQFAALIYFTDLYKTIWYLRIPQFFKTTFLALARNFTKVSKKFLNVAKYSNH